MTTTIPKGSKTFCEPGEERMVCPDYLVSGLWCLKGIPVTKRFSIFFCETMPEKCPFVVRENEISKIAGLRRAKPFKDIRRMP